MILNSLIIVGYYLLLSRFFICTILLFIFLRVFL
nr:MAG TPA: hypothetical protein [Caudoviricetes sp.]